MVKVYKYGRMGRNYKVFEVIMNLMGFVNLFMLVGMCMKGFGLMGKLMVKELIDI